MSPQNLRLLPRYLDLYTNHPFPIDHEIDRISIAGQTWVKHLRGDEEDILLRAVRLLTQDRVVIIGYNSMIFDLPFISMRMVALNLPSSMISRLSRTYHVDLSDVVHHYLQPFGRFTNWKEIIPMLGMPSNASKLDVTRELYERTVDLCKQDLQTRYHKHCPIVFEGE